MATEYFIEPGFRAIHEMEVFDFSEAQEACNEALRPFRGQGQAEHEFAFDFTLLSAAEFALMPSLIDPSAGDLSLPLSEPVEVRGEDVWAAAARADCGFTNLHGIKGSPERVRLWDVMLFAGDMAKAEIAGFEGQIDIDSIDQIVDSIESLYRESVTPQGPELADRGLVKLQGMLWTAKLALQVDQNSLGEHVRTYANTHGLT